MTEWTNGETTIGSLTREGHVTESFTITNPVPTNRQVGFGQFLPSTVTLTFGMYDGPWECTGALVDGRIIKKDGTLAEQYTKAHYIHFLDDEYTDAPTWLIHLAKSRLGVVKHANYRT